MKGRERRRSTDETSGRKFPSLLEDRGWPGESERASIVGTLSFGANGDLLCIKMKFVRVEISVIRPLRDAGGSRVSAEA